MIMLAIAGGIAVARGADVVATAVHAGDHFIYPDCRPAFIQKLSEAMQLGNEGFGFDSVAYARTGPIFTPFIDATKADIAVLALQLGVPLHETWSCYKGREIHCGKCGTCVERLEAIEEAALRMNAGQGIDNVPGNYYGGEYDRTEYADVDFWKQAVANA